MASVIVINGGATSRDNVNAAGADIPAYSVGTGGLGTAATLTAAELDTLLSTGTVAVIPAALTTEQRRQISKVLRLGRNPGVS
jgi:long-subunit fatty acid transport protein